MKPMTACTRSHLMASECSPVQRSITRRRKLREIIWSVARPGRTKLHRALLRRKLRESMGISCVLLRVVWISAVIENWLIPIVVQQDRAYPLMFSQFGSANTITRGRCRVLVIDDRPLFSVIASTHFSICPFGLSFRIFKTTMLHLVPT